MSDPLDDYTPPPRGPWHRELWLTVRARFDGWLDVAHLILSYGLTRGLALVHEGKSPPCRCFACRRHP